MRRGIALLALLLVAACGGPAERDEPSEPASGQVEDVVTGLQAPWSIAFAGDRALVTERDSARILAIEDGEASPLTGPGADAVRDRTEGGGEGGLLGIAVRDDEVFVYLTARDDNRILRMGLDGDELGEPTTLVERIPKAGNHNGGRIAFGPDGALYAGTGDAGDRESAQDDDSLAGKILRIDVDDERTEVFSLGHRNVQGLAWTPDGDFWASEFGQNTWDELNRVDEGANHGWPLVEGQGGEGGFVDPEHVWSTDEASPSGIAATDDAVFMAGLRGARLWRIPLDGGDPEVALDGYGRLRDVVVAPDGTLWVLTNNTDGRGDPRDGDDRILRFTP